MFSDTLYSIAGNVSRIDFYVFLLVILSTYFLILKCSRDPRLVKFAKELPGSSGLPLIGNSLEFVFSGYEGVNKVLNRYSKIYGSVYKLWLGNQLVVGLSNTDHVEAVFRSTKTLSKPKTLFAGFIDLYGNSLFTSSGPVWKKTRKRLQPIFARNVLKFQVPLFNEYVEKHVKKLEKHAAGPEFDIKCYTIDLVIDALLGIYYNIHLTDAEKEYFNFNELFESSTFAAFSKMFYPWLRMSFISKLYFGSTVEKKLRQFFEKLKFTGPVHKIEEWDGDMEKSEKLTKSFLQIIQHQQEELKIEHYAYNESTDLIVAAAGTTPTALAYCLLAIAMHPNVQKKLRNEVLTMLGDNNAIFSADDLDKYQYLDQVIRETHRRFTLIRNLFREVQENIKIGSLTVPAGTAIMIRSADIHMNPDLYPNPEEFNPENFSTDAVSQRSKYAYIPLSSGIRNCIGKYWSDNIMKLTVIRILQKFELHTTLQMKDMDYMGAITAEKKNFWIGLKPHE